MATGDKLVNLDELKLVYDKLHVPSVQVQIPTGQWSGSSTRTYTVNATNVTADTIVDWAMDSSINYLKADLTVTPGSGTIQFSTTAIPAGTINVTLFFPGVNGEVVIQTLADVYSKSQVDTKIAQSTAIMAAERPTTANALDTVINDMDANTLRFTPCGAYNGVVADLTGTTGLADWFVLTFKYSSALAFQFEFRGGNSSANRHIYVRQYNNGTWSSVTTLV